MTNGTYTLGYWKIRGLAAPIRIAFAFAGKDLKEDVFGWEKTEEGKISSPWSATYSKLQADNEHPFPNLPYLITPDGDMLVQSNAIIRHVGRVLGLFGNAADEKSVMRIDELLEQINDLRVEAVTNYYSPDGISEAFVSGAIPYYLTVLEKHMTSSKIHATGANEGPFFFGGAPTIVDFLVYEILRTALPLVEQKRAEYEAAHPKVFNFVKAVEAIPELQQFFKSEAHGLAANGPGAKHWGAKVE